MSRRGRGTVTVKVSSMRARARRQVNAAIKWQAEAAEREARIEAANKARAEEEAAEAARLAAEEAAKVPVVEGKITITGEILTIKLQDGHFGSTLKMLVRDDRGFKVWGTYPRSLDDAEKGDRVAFVATVTASGTDKDFGFFSRPTQAKIVAKAGEVS